MAADPCKGLLTKYPPNSPERAAQVKACFDKKRAGRVKKQMASPTTTTKPITGNSGKSPVQSAIDTFKGDTWRTG